MGPRQFPSLWRALESILSRDAWLKAKSLASPCGKVTGVTVLSTELGGKRVELVKEAVPKIARIAVLYDPAIPRNELEVKEVLPVAASALGLTARFWEIRAAGDFEKVFAGITIRWDY